MPDSQAARLNMVDAQLRTNRVTDPELLTAFETVPRELFLPEALRGLAYIDEDIRISENRYLMEPMVLARLIQAAEPQAGDVAIDVGCGTGYATAILARLVATAIGLECRPEFARQASEILSGIDADNAVVIEGPLSDGYARQAPYNVILINGAVPDLPQALLDQLADGGRLVAVVRRERDIGRATLALRTGEVVSSRVLFDASIPILPEFDRAPGFVF